MNLFEQYVERGTDALTDKELDALDAEFLTAFEEAAHQHGKGES